MWGVADLLEAALKEEMQIQPKADATRLQRLNRDFDQNDEDGFKGATKGKQSKDGGHVAQEMVNQPARGRAMPPPSL